MNRVLLLLLSGLSLSACVSTQSAFSRSRTSGFLNAEMTETVARVLKDMQEVRSDEGMDIQARREVARRDYVQPMRVEYGQRRAMKSLSALYTGFLGEAVSEMMPTFIVVSDWHRGIPGPTWGVVLGWRDGDLWVDGQGLGRIERVNVQNALGPGGWVDLQRRLVPGRMVKLHYELDCHGRFQFRDGRHRLLAQVE